jgi:hypothetical protein
MATRTASLVQASRNGRAQPDERPELESSPELGVLNGDHVLGRARRRQSRALITLAVAFVAAPLVLAALGHALVASDQVRSDALQTQVAQSLQVQQDLQLQKAELVAPSRILTIAETRLHMVTPTAVTYLPPVNPGETVAEAHEPSSATSPAHHAASKLELGGSPSGSATSSRTGP